MYCHNMSTSNREVEVHIEVPKNTSIKYEYDHHGDKLVCDRILFTPITYPFNYGYIPNTMSGDGDPLDAIVLMEEPLISNCYINCKVIDVLETIDEKGKDDKLILVPADSVDPSSINIQTINDIDISLRQKVIFFYEHYKKLEPNKWVTVTEFKGREYAERLLDECTQS